MDIFSALMTWSAAVLGPAVGGMFVVMSKGWWDQRKAMPIGSLQEVFFRRTWRGEYGSDEPTEGSVAIEMQLEIKGNNVTGTAYYAWQGRTTELAIDGKVCGPSILKLDYTNKERSQLHFGTMILTLNAGRDELDGVLAAHARDPDKPRSGHVHLSRS